VRVHDVYSFTPDQCGHLWHMHRVVPQRTANHIDRCLETTQLTHDRTRLVKRMQAAHAQVNVIAIAESGKRDQQLFGATDVQRVDHMQDS
jgi:hypothetical protein